MFYEPIWEYQGFKLAKRPDTANFHITWYKPGTGRFRRKSTGTSDLDEAKQELIRFADIWSSSAPPPADSVLVLDVISDYVERKLETASGTCALKTALKHFAAFCDRFGLVHVSDLSFGVVEEYVAWRRTALLRSGFQGSNGTVNRELRVIRAALNDAVRRRTLSEAPAVPLLSEPPPRQRFLSREEAQSLLMACEHPHLRLFVLLALHTLQRPGALFQLRAEQIDFARRRIDFLPAGVAQSNKRRPVVPITQTIMPHLQQAMTESVTGHVLEWNCKPIKSVKRTFNKARMKAGLGPEVIPYTLRHTGATLMAGAGVPLWQIAGMLGHSHTKTTELYAKHQPEYLGKAAEALDELFGESETTSDVNVVRLPLPERRHQVGGLHPQRTG